MRSTREKPIENRVDQVPKKEKKRKKVCKVFYDTDCTKQVPQKEKENKIK